jgi:hypothetical protein
MTHDPLCPRATYDMPCCCNLIERVRAHERQRFVNIVDQRTTELTTCGHENCRTLADGARLALNECLASI